MSPATIDNWLLVGESLFTTLDLASSQGTLPLRGSESRLGQGQLLKMAGGKVLLLGQPHPALQRELLKMGCTTSMLPRDEELSRCGARAVLAWRSAHARTPAEKALVADAELARLAGRGAANTNANANAEVNANANTNTNTNTITITNANANANANTNVKAVAVTTRDGTVAESPIVPSLPPTPTVAASDCANVTRRHHHHHHHLPLSSFFTPLARTSSATLSPEATNEDLFATPCTPSTDTKMSSHETPSSRCSLKWKGVRFGSVTIHHLERQVSFDDAGTPRLRLGSRPSAPPQYRHLDSFDEERVALRASPGKLRRVPVSYRPVLGAAAAAAPCIGGGGGGAGDGGQGSGGGQPLLVSPVATTARRADNSSGHITTRDGEKLPRGFGLHDEDTIKEAEDRQDKDKDDDEKETKEENWNRVEEEKKNGSGKDSEERKKKHQQKKKKATPKKASHWLLMPDGKLYPDLELSKCTSAVSFSDGQRCVTTRNGSKYVLGKLHPAVRQQMKQRGLAFDSAWPLVHAKELMECSKAAVELYRSPSPPGGSNTLKGALSPSPSPSPACGSCIDFGSYTSTKSSGGNSRRNSSSSSSSSHNSNMNRSRSAERRQERGRRRRGKSRSAVGVTRGRARTHAMKKRAAALSKSPPSPGDANVTSSRGGSSSRAGSSSRSDKSSSSSITTRSRREGAKRRAERARSPPSSSSPFAATVDNVAGAQLRGGSDKGDGDGGDDDDDDDDDDDGFGLGISRRLTFPPESANDLPKTAARLPHDKDKKGDLVDRRLTF